MMKHRNSNPLLLEVMIAVLFLALCSMVMMEMFVLVKNMNDDSELRSRALIDVQNMSERIYASDDIVGMLMSDGYLLNGDVWQLAADDYMIKIELADAETSAGNMTTAKIEAVIDGETVISVPCARYRSMEAD